MYSCSRDSTTSALMSAYTSKQPRPQPDSKSSQLGMSFGRLSKKRKIDKSRGLSRASGHECPKLKNGLLQNLVLCFAVQREEVMQQYIT
mmetsp:Transcript_159108/g.290208  ORF Transcript_159108/g.290208 Transcript_159108/m.290208 type:complete len:89 (-) Transcript_159108:22-288(-)